MASNQMELAGTSPAGDRGAGLSTGRIARLYRTSVGKKIVMAVTGLGLLLFVLAHMLGNLKIYFGPEEYNRYAEHLREIGLPILSRTMALWMVRIVLLACLILHMVAAIQLAIQSRQAREVRYHVHGGW
jgi:succinate dehydrogenase / fumarate reductase cytochrome b subunit